MASGQVSTTTRPQSVLADTSNAPAALRPYIVPGYSDFVSEPKDETSGGATGNIGFDEADSADCDPGLQGRSEWVASFLEYFKHSPSPNPNIQSQSAYMTVCVTELMTQADASQNSANWDSKQTMPVHIDLSFLAPNTAIFYQVGLAYTVFFAKYNFLVAVVSVDETDAALGKTFALSMAGAEANFFNRPPSQ